MRSRTAQSVVSPASAGNGGRSGGPVRAVPPSPPVSHEVPVTMPGTAARSSTTRRALVCALLGCALVTVAPLASGSPAPAASAPAAREITALVGLNQASALAFDSAGDLFIANSGNNTVTVLPRTTGSVFGQPVVAGRMAALVMPAGLLDRPAALAFDSAGDLFIANNSGPDSGTTDSLTVLPRGTGTVFGQPVTADQAAMLTASTGLDGPDGMAFDAAGDLFVANYGYSGDASVTVVPRATGTVFGQLVTADQATTLTAASASQQLDDPMSLAFDSAGDLFIANGNYNDSSITVVPRATGTVFGQPVTAGTATRLLAAGSITPLALAFDAAGDLFISGFVGQTSASGTDAPGSGVILVPHLTGMVLSQPVTADRSARLTAASGLDNPDGMAFDAAGNLFVLNGGNGTVGVVPLATGTVFGQPVTASKAAMLTAASALDGAQGLAFDAGGDLFIANAGNNTVTILPGKTGTLFGQRVTAGRATVLTAASGLTNPDGLSLDASGNLYIDNHIPRGTVTVVPRATGKIFGQPVRADRATVLAAATGLIYPDALAFDAAGDLFVLNANATVTVVPLASGRMFGQRVTADSAAVLSAFAGRLVDPTSIAVDTTGDLFVADGDGGPNVNYSRGEDTLIVLPRSSRKLFGQPVTAGTATALRPAQGLPLTPSTGLLDNPRGVAFDPAGDLFIANAGDDSVTVLPDETGRIYGQPMTAGSAVTLTAASGLNQPDGLAFDPTGDLFVEDNWPSVHEVVRPVLTTVGTATTASVPTTSTTARSSRA
ncbi:MAG TPA: hypothetical protein VME46_07825 [Acidimicrobiales bacterium]|nr:hypothetical protein [Acidimicrobiales bacterium]